MAKWSSVVVFSVLSICIFLKTAPITAVADESAAFFDKRSALQVEYRESLKTRLVNVGRAPFAIASPKFDCDSLVSSLKSLKYLHIAWLFNTFGKDYQCLSRILKDPRLVTLQINLINEPGHRNRRLEPHEFLYTVKSPQDFDRLLRSKDARLKRRFERYVSPLQDLLASRLQSRTRCYINPGLESNVGTLAGRVLVRWTRDVFPFCKIVWNPIAKTLSARGTGANVVEQHGWNVTFSTNACIFNNDGSDINFPQRKPAAVLEYEKGLTPLKNWINAGNPLQSAIEQYANQCKVVYLWTSEDNCFDFDKQGNPWIPPLTRGCKSGPVNGLVAAEVKRAMDLGVRVPQDLTWSASDEISFNGCAEIRSPFDGAKNGFLLKQSEFADRGGVVITPVTLNGASSVTVEHKGKLIDSYVRSGSYTHDNKNRALWRSRKSPLAYPLKVAVKVKVGSRAICYRVDNPRVRAD